MKENLRKFGSKRFLGLTTTQILILVILLVMLFFFSDNSISKRLQQEKQIKHLESQIEYYRGQSAADSRKLHELQSSKEDIEKFARENYYMKKEGEEIFIIK